MINFCSSIPGGLITGARSRRWQTPGQTSKASGLRLEAALAALSASEEYHAYPGARLLAALTERIATNDAGGAAKLARRISNGLLTRAYRGRPAEWDVHDEMSSGEVADIMPPSSGETGSPALFRSALRQQPAGGPLACACGRNPAPAPAGGCFHLRADLRWFLRGCLVRGAL